MNLYSEGDVQAFELLYQRHKGPVYRFFTRQFSDAVAEELMQDVWTRIIKARKEYQRQAKFTTFLYTIVRNRQIDYIRRLTIRPVSSETGYGNYSKMDHNNNHNPDANDPVSAIQAPVSDEPDCAIGNHEKQNALLHCIKELPSTQREVFLLKEESGLNLDSIAQIVGINTESVKSRLRYALQKLRQCLGTLLEH